VNRPRAELSSTVLPTILRTDAIGCAVLGVAALAAAGPIASHLGVTGATPVRLVGAALVVYALELMFVAHRPSVRRVQALVVADLVFGLAVLMFVLLDPTGVTTATRWVGAALADLSLLFAALKLWGLRRARTGSTTDRYRTTEGAATYRS
jgi:hypothetical protein